MTFKASWSFLDESAVTLVTKLNWLISNTSTGYAAPLSADAYTYAAYPGTHWYLALLQSIWFEPPGIFQPGTDQSGCWTWAMKQANAGSGDVVVHSEGAYYNKVNLSTNTVFSIYVRSVFQESSAPQTPTLWHYYCFKSDMESNPYKAEFWVDGVMILSGTEVEATPRTNSTIRFNPTGIHSGTVPSTGTYYAGISYWDDYADTAQTPAYFSTGDPTEDISEADISASDAWVATNGDTDRFTEVSGVYDEAKNVSKTTPADGDNMILGIGGAGGTDDIGDQLGFDAGGVILGLSMHIWAEGEAVNAHAAIGDGSNITAGAVTLISDTGDPTHLHVGTALSPTGPAWALTNQPEIIFEMD
jgi:hypothetical protein